MSDSPTTAGFPFDRWSLWLFVAGLVPLAVATLFWAIGNVLDGTAEEWVRVLMQISVFLAILIELVAVVFGVRGRRSATGLVGLVCASIVLSVLLLSS